MTIQFFEPCIPPKTTKQVSGRRKGDPAAVKLAAAFWKAIARKHAPDKPMDGPVRLDLAITWEGEFDKPRPWHRKPDGDNIEKLAWDAMAKAGWFHDDAQIADHRTRKFSGATTGVAVMCGTINEEDT